MKIEVQNIVLLLFSIDILLSQWLANKKIKTIAYTKHVFINLYAYTKDVVINDQTSDRYWEKFANNRFLEKQKKGEKHSPFGFVRDMNYSSIAYGIT